MKQRSPTSQMFRFLLDVQTFHPTGFFSVQHKNNNSKPEKHFEHLKGYIYTNKVKINRYQLTKAYICYVTL